MSDQTQTSIAEAAQAYQGSLPNNQSQADTADPQSLPAPHNPMDGIPDTPMQDAPPANVQSQSAGHSPAPASHSTASTPAPAPTATPTRSTNGVSDGGKGAPNEPDITPIPTRPVPHGAPARRYLNERVTGVLLEGMKRLAKEQPKDPLRVLGEHLLQKSKELENT